MIIDLDKLGDSSKKFEFSVPAGDLDLDTENVRLKGDTLASGEVRKSIAKIDVSGTITVPAEVDCTRCPDADRKGLDILVSTSVSCLLRTLPRRRCRIGYERSGCRRNYQ